ncbi:tyrosine-type recombinase/integrase [Bacillus infantis]|uniref:tyrosine-type recombinase/integrase n=1 Tax=Bacillus infantis TaxID=324767 RepID=UPI003CEFB431
MAGSIHKYKTSKGEVKYFVMLEIGENGKRKQKKKMGFKTKKEATAYLAETQTALNKGSYIEPSKVSFKDFMNEWFTTIKKKSVRTNDTYRILIEKYVNVYFVDVPLSSLKSIHVEDFINKMHEQGYSPATIRKVYNIITNALDYAVDKGLIIKNVAKKATLPKDNKKEMSVWTKDEVNKFLNTAKNDRLYILFVMALMTGMRQGELFGLRWRDINFETSKLTVKQTLAHNGKEFYTGAKTNAGNRSIGLSKSLIDKLMEHKELIAKEKAEMGDSYIDQDLVFCTPMGTPLNAANIRKRLFNPLIEEAGVPQIRFHDLRHTHATSLLADGVNVKVISERLGHSNIKVTLDTYSHVLPTMQQEAVDKLNSMFEL